jgi:AcrR family transcriptional regulator
MTTQPISPAARTGDTHARILDAAIDLFSIQSFSGVSIRDIARAVGIKESSIYNHFASKDALLAEIFTLYEGEYAKLIPSEELVEHVLNTITPEQFWKNGFRNFKEMMGSPRMEKMTRILTMEMYRNPRAQEILLENAIYKPIDFAEKIFRKLIDRGQILALDPHLLAVEFQSTLFALYIEYLVLHSSGKNTEVVEQRVTDPIHFFRELVKREQQE